MSEGFNIDDLVWAKLRYCQPWPAKVVEPPVGARQKNCYYVYFYGSKNFGWVKENNISHYYISPEEKAKLENKTSPYAKAVQEIEEIIVNSEYLKQITEDENNELVYDAFGSENIEESDNSESSEQTAEDEKIEPVYASGTENVESENSGYLKQTVEGENNAPMSSFGTENVEESGNSLDVKENASAEKNEPVCALEAESIETSEEPSCSLKSNIDFYDSIVIVKPNFTKSEQEKRQKKVSKLLKGLWLAFGRTLEKPKKQSVLNNKINKNKIEKRKKSSGTKTTSRKSHCQSSSIPSSSCITVNVQDYKRIIVKECAVLLRRCDAGLPSTAHTFVDSLKCQPDKARNYKPVILKECNVLLRRYDAGLPPLKLYNGNDVTASLKPQPDNPPFLEPEF